MARISESGIDFSHRGREELVRVFRWWAEIECLQIGGYLYRACSRGIAGDDELLALAGRADATQLPPNMLFAAVHYLLLGGAKHELREWYPAIAAGEVRDPDTGFAPFRSFCLEHHDALAELIETRLTQTNVIQRCSALLPAFAHVYQRAGGAPLSLIEIGPSAGLNLQWDRFRYAYDDGDIVWGDAKSEVVVPCELRGDTPLPKLSPEISVDWRRGVDINPIDLTDADAVQWLRALIWPEHVARHARLASAIEVAQLDPPEIVKGSAADRLPELIAAAPPYTRVCVYGTHTLYQFPPDALRATLKGMQAASRDRPIDFITMESTGDECSEVKHVAYREGERETTVLANANPHGHWLEWLA